RRYWNAYQEAYTAVLERCNPDSAPWYVVPAGRKWYRNWAVATLLLETLTDMAPTWPDPALDVPALRARLMKERPVHEASRGRQHLAHHPRRAPGARRRPGEPHRRPVEDPVRL